MRGRVSLVALGALFAALAAAGRARADDAAATPAARALYDQATQAMDKKDFASACPKLEEVVRLVPEGVGARLTLGECYEGAGKLASAWSAFAEAASTASRSGQEPRAAKARAAAEALRPRLATLTLEVAPSVRAIPGLTVERDGAPASAGTFGVAIPVDKGAHAVTARAPGRASFEKTAEVAADGAHVTVTIDDLPAASGGASSEPPKGAPVTPAKAGSTSPLVYVGFVTAGVGFGVGTVAGIITLSKASTCKSATGCTSGAIDGAKATAWVSDIGLGVGILGAGVGIVAWVTSRKPSPTSGVATALVRLGPGNLRVEGTF